MKVRPIFVLAALGVALGFIAAFYLNIKEPAEPPVFNPAPNPYAQGIYSNGIIESYQSSGENINIYPEVSGTVRAIFVTEGQNVKAGTPLLQLDDSVQRATAEQIKSQADAAFTVLEELRAQPRKETLAVSAAQVKAAQANVKNTGDQFEKIQVSRRLNPRSISKNEYDNALNAAHIARTNLEVAVKQYELTKAGAWIYEIRNQEKQFEALSAQYQSSQALLDKYLIKAPTEGTILSIKTALGSYISSLGVYGTYTQNMNPVLVMGGNSSEQYLQVRAYVDEILVHRLPNPSEMTGEMFIRGTNINVPLEFVRMQPYITPKIELSSERQERVDVRVLPIIFKFEKPKEVNLFPGQLVDVYMGEKTAKQLSGKTSKTGGKNK